MPQIETSTRFAPRATVFHSLSLGVGVAMLMFALLVGCRPPTVRPTARRKDSNAETVSTANSDFRVAFDFLDNFHQFDPEEVGQRITYHLQRWGSTQQPDPDWIEDPLIKRLPKRFASSQTDGYLARLRFDTSAFDVVILREAIWARDLALQIDKAALHDRRLADWLSANGEGLNEESLEELTTAAKIFDWTVRNIQLEKLPYKVPAAKVPAAKVSTAADGDDESQPETLVPPDGAMFLPAEAMLIGRGDWIVRARIANLIARQVGLATVVLAVEDESGEERPWCWAILIEGQLHLFDFRLGLPIPGEAGAGIAKLSTVIEKPDLLRQLDLEADDFGKARKYPIAADDLKRLVALMDATPESLSQRMKLVERNLTGDRRLVLTTAPSAFAVDLRSSTGVTGARLWHVPFEIYSFRQNLKDSIHRSLTAGKPGPKLPVTMSRMNAEMQIVDGSGRLSLPRRQHFRGAFADTDDEEGAKSGYMASRAPDSVINSKMDLRALHAQGLVPSVPKDEVTRANVVTLLRSRMRTSKEYATFWLGLIAFEEGKYEVAVNYFEKRVLKVSPEGPWTELATYNLARAYEQLGISTDEEEKWSKSRELLRSLKKAPQSDGDRIRAARE